MNRRTFLHQATLLSLAALGCGKRDSEGARHPALPPYPPVVMVVLDTVRADHVSAWGYGRRTTPNLDRLAKSATRYANAVSPAPWTLPAHASLFTGAYPFEHGAHTRLRRLESGGISVYEPPLEDAAETLAEALSGVGYATGAFVANTVFLSERYNVLQGFDTRTVERVAGTVLAEKGLTWAADQKDTPFFLFFNFMDAHRPYNLTPRPTVADWEVPEDPELLDELHAAVMPGMGPIPHGLVEEVARQYDLGIVNADVALGQVIMWLERAGLYDEALIIVTSDHGEFLGEHHLVEHSKDVYQPTAWVPLVVKLPRQAMSRVETRWTSLCAMPGLVLDAVVDDPGERFVEMLHGYEGGRQVLSENYYARAWDFEHEVWGHRFRRRRTAIYEGAYKLIHSSDGQHELYNLEADPAEENNLASQQPARVAVLIEQLEAFKPLHGTDVIAGDANLPAFSPEQIEEMEALGYLGTGDAGATTPPLSPAP